MHLSPGDLRKDSIGASFPRDVCCMQIRTQDRETQIQIQIQIPFTHMTHDNYNGRCLVPTFRPRNNVLRLPRKWHFKVNSSLPGSHPLTATMITSSTHRNNGNCPCPPHERRGLNDFFSLSLGFTPAPPSVFCGGPRTIHSSTETLSSRPAWYAQGVLGLVLRCR